MSQPVEPEFQEIELSDIAVFTGKIVVFLDADTPMDAQAKRVNKLTKGALARLLESDVFTGLKPSEGIALVMPAGLAAEAILAVKLPRRPTIHDARKAGAWIAKNTNSADLLVLAVSNAKAGEIALGVSLRNYDFLNHKTEKDKPRDSKLTIAVRNATDTAADYASHSAVAQGVFFTRDLVNEPSNILNTTEFADRLKALKSLGVEVEVLEEAALKKLGMHALLGVGLGSETPTKMVVMKWQCGGKEAPFALVGKGVVFDTGGISIKPAAGMEDMTMDMGGAGVVAGVMKTLALRKAKANVVGLVGLVENMPDGKAQRPGDVVTSMKGDTIEIINTDAEGRLVLADVLWYAQEKIKPSRIINLATLTGAILVGLGHENAGVFSNDDDLCKEFLKSAQQEGEGAWRMPLGAAYDDLIKSRIADMKNTGGRMAGSITAAQFLQRFVKDDMPWIHLDIAGVALRTTASDLAPKGATGWGVMALNRLIADNYEDLGR